VVYLLGEGSDACLMFCLLSIDKIGHVCILRGNE
jgi:hypothetical protein